MKKNIKPLFTWAKKNADANINDRILIKVMPQLLKENIQITSKIINSSDSLEIPEKLYDLVVQKAEELVGVKYV